MTNDISRLKEITTTSGVKVTLLDWITGREYQQINAPMFAQMKMKPSQNGMETSTITMDVATLMDNEAIRTIVKSVDGKTDNILDAVLDLRIDDFNEVMVNVRETIGGKKK